MVIAPLQVRVDGNTIQNIQSLSMNVAPDEMLTVTLRIVVKDINIIHEYDGNVISINHP
jgi:hypothetical protein